MTPNQASFPYEKFRLPVGISEDSRLSEVLDSPLFPKKCAKYSGLQWIVRSMRTIMNTSHHCAGGIDVWLERLH